MQKINNAIYYYIYKPKSLYAKYFYDISSSLNNNDKINEYVI